MFTRQSWGVAAAILAIAAGVTPAWGQRVIAVTVARNAQGEPARLVASSADFDVGGVLPGGHVLPGTALTGPLVRDRDFRAVFASTGARWNGGTLEAHHRESALTILRSAPFDRYPDADDHSTPGWREYVVAPVRDDRTLSHLLVTAAIGRDNAGAYHGWLEARPWPPEGTPSRAQSPGGVTPLAIAPRLAVPLAGSRVLAIGASDGTGPALLQRADAAAGAAEAPRSFASEDHPHGQQHLSGALVTQDRTTVWVLFSSLAGETPASWVYAIDAQSLEAVGPPMALTGIARDGARQLAAGPGGDCWIATRTPGTDFGRVVRLSLPNSGEGTAIEEVQSYSLVGVQQGIALSANPETGDLLVAKDNFLAYWPSGQQLGLGHGFDAPIEALLWTDAGPVVGEGNRLHRIGIPECAPEETILLQSGWVVDAAWIPASALPAPDQDGDGVDDETERRMQTRADDPDTDGDGIPDGSDPHPNAPSPRLVVGAEVVFPHTAVGRQLRALQIESRGAPDAQWQVHVDQEALPWLRVHPPNFRGSGYAYMGVDPERFDPSGVVSGTIEVSLTGRPRGNRPGFTAAYSPATVHVRVEPPRDPLRTMLWLWPAEESGTSFRGAGDPRRLKRMGDLAAGYPFFFSTVEHYGPISAPLRGYSIVVVTARAAAEGALTQKALFDYLNDGGAVLFLGEHLEGEQFRDLGPWLAPLGVEVDMREAVQGSFHAAGGHELRRHWDGFTLRDGCTLSAEHPADVVAPIEPGKAAAVARTHGYGRIALLAAPTPLETDALDAPANRAFALDLLYWLSRAGYAVADLDGDGLLDGTEDRNNNSAVDAGETAWLNPDTDGDGLPDGMEDTNRNGVVDAGETDPRQADTDGDGILDGADGSPLG